MVADKRENDLEVVNSGPIGSVLSIICDCLCGPLAGCCHESSCGPVPVPPSVALCIASALASNALVAFSTKYSSAQVHVSLTPKEGLPPIPDLPISQRTPSEEGIRNCQCRKCGLSKEADVFRKGWSHKAASLGIQTGAEPRDPWWGVSLWTMDLDRFCHLAIFESVATRYGTGVRFRGK